MIDQIQKRAAELLTQKQVAVVIGYEQGSEPSRVRPCFITKPEDAKRLVWNKFCFHNLATYLTRDEVMKLGKPAIIAKGCDSRAIVCLIQEAQLKREDVHILGVACEGVGEPLAAKCRACKVNTPPLCDELIGPKIEPKAAQDDPLAEVKALDGKSLDERWAFWQKEFERCFRCYACRQACPLCYCDRCIVEKNQPQWIETSAHQRGNLAWHIIRAFHLAGRCIGCGECERACPMGIKLTLLNKKLAKEVEAHFQYVPGLDVEAEPALAAFRQEDDEEFIR